MDDLINKLSDIRNDYNCFDEDENPYYRALLEANKILSEREDGDTIRLYQVLTFPVPNDAELAYYKGMKDGIKKCTERLKKFNDENK